MPRQDPKNAVAAAKLVVSQRRRKPVGISELQERLGISENRYFCLASGPAGDEKKKPARRILVMYCQLGRTAETSGGIGKKVSRHEAGDTSVE